jgi:hypothetical protein
MTPTPPTATNPTTGSKIRKAFGMSADSVNFWANWFLVAALVIGVVSTYLVVVSGNAKEANLKSELRDKDDALEKYKLETGEKISEANARQKEAELKLEQLRRLSGPRNINFDIFKKELEGKPKAHVQIWYLPDVSDGYQARSYIRSRGEGEATPDSRKWCTTLALLWPAR